MLRWIRYNSIELGFLAIIIAGAAAIAYSIQWQRQAHRECQVICAPHDGSRTPWERCVCNLTTTVPPDDADKARKGEP